MRIAAALAAALLAGCSTAPVALSTPAPATPPPPMPAPAPPIPPGVPMGYAATITGGAGGPLCEAGDVPSLQACLAGDNPALVTLTAPIAIHAQRVDVGSNKTLAGGSIVSDSYGLWITGHNDIITGVKFTGSGVNLYPSLGSRCDLPYLQQTDLVVSGCAVPIYLTASASLVWIDRNDFGQCGDKCIVGWGLGTVPDLVTISNNVFHDSFYAVLFGVDPSASNASLPPQGHVTFYRNQFTRIMRRSPRCSTAYACDVANNEITDFGQPTACDDGFGPSAESASVLLRANLITAWPNGCKAASDVRAYVDKLPGGRIGPMGVMGGAWNVLTGGATLPGVTTAIPFKPPYTLPLAPAAALNLTAGVP